jgi:dolichol-phosphate mannosyltransferase
MILIVLPAYNEESTLPPLLDAIAYHLEEMNYAYRVVVVDDGSSDRTGAIIDAAALDRPLVPVHHPQNLGLSEAIKTGLLKAVELAGPRDIIVTMDADNTHTPGLIMQMVRMVREGHDVVIASRYQRGARVIGVPWYRHLLSDVGSMIFRLLLPIPGVRDFTSGYRAYRAELLKEMFERFGERFIDEPGFSCMVDILLKMRPYPLIIGEVPLILRYDKKEGVSKMKVLKTVRQTLRLIVRRRLGLP